MRALADKDAAALARLLADDVDFYGMTPARLWRARGARQAIDEVLLVWFEPDDLVQEVVSVEPACTWSSSAPTSTSSTTVTMTTPVAPPGASAA